MAIRFGGQTPPIPQRNKEPQPEAIVAKVAVAKKAMVEGSRGPEKRTKQITLRIDIDVVDAFKGTGAGWQTRINRILRDNMPGS